ncbi:MAG: hypothetical protein K2Y26_10635 [Gemmatimonadaceae bacterium]|nr:hypothetical protein [Gemmatimonadaceae bacterium]
MREMRDRLALSVVVLAAFGNPLTRSLAAQQSARGALEPVPVTRADRARAESATAQKCLTASAQAAQALIEPQLHIIEGVDASQRGQRSFLNATRVRNQQATHCTPVPAKPVVLPAKPDSTR